MTKIPLAALACASLLLPAAALFAAPMTTVHFHSGHSLQVASALKRGDLWELTLLSGGTLKLRAEVVDRVDNATPLEADPGNRLSVSGGSRPSDPAAGRSSEYSGSPATSEGGASGSPAPESFRRSNEKEFAPPAEAAGAPAELLKDGQMLTPRQAPPKSAAGSAAAPIRPGPVKGGIWRMKKQANQAAELPGRKP